MDNTYFFECRDEKLQRLYEEACKKLKNNIRSFAGRDVLVEGAGYQKIWLETQPMGGEMAYFYCPEAAVNNTLLFMENQREDGRLPGSIACTDGVITPQYDKLQGFCFPAPALNLYYLSGRDRLYLDRLKDCLIRFDGWLHRTRDLSGNGVLSSFCVYDTGEDNALRYGDAPCYAPEDEPPLGNRFVPMQSMDITSFSYACRETLAEIAGIEANGTDEKYWSGLAAQTRDALKKHLWDEKRAACFDRYADGSVCDVLCHNSLRCMYWHSFDPDMAKRFVAEHLVNEKEFFTPVPLPSVAADDPLFANLSENNWSGQPEGLTYQRAIRALENYGFDSLVPVLGKKLMDTVAVNDCRFCQQYDPFTGKAASEKDGYGPTILAVLEYLNRMHGIDYERGVLRFSDIGGVPFRACMRLNRKEYTIDSDGNETHISAAGKDYLMRCGNYLITDENGENPDQYRNI